MQLTSGESFAKTIVKNKGLNCGNDYDIILDCGHETMADEATTREVGEEYHCQQCEDSAE